MTNDELTTQIRALAERKVPYRTGDKVEVLDPRYDALRVAHEWRDVGDRTTVWVCIECHKIGRDESPCNPRTDLEACVRVAAEQGYAALSAVLHAVDNTFFGDWPYGAPPSPGDPTEAAWRAFLAWQAATS